MIVHQFSEVKASEVRVVVDDTDIVVRLLHLCCGTMSGTPSVNDQLSGVTEGSSQMNIWPAAQTSPGALG